jgi:alpha-1,2-mannosyltransferase
VIDTHGLAFSYPIARFLTHGLTQQTTKPPMPIIAYIHYPTISASMLKRIESRSTTYANSSTITSSTWRSTAKTLYYRLFTFFYTSALRVIVPPTFIAVNSSWTKAHVEALLATRSAESTVPGLGFLGAVLDLGSMLVGWNLPSPKGINQPPKEGVSSNIPTLNVPAGIRRIYPPCDVDPLRAFPLGGRKKVVFSCAQFRYVHLVFFPRS